MYYKYPLLSLDEARAYEASVLEGDLEKTAFAVENAGRAIGLALLEDYREVRPWRTHPEILILAGKGLNTADAIIACGHVHKAIPGVSVSIVLTEDRNALGSLTASALDGLQADLGDQLQVYSVDEYLALEPFTIDVVLDGIYGHGFRPPLSENASILLTQINQRNDILLRAAIDLPSGLGTERDPQCFVADLTYIPGVAKAPCFSTANESVIGRIRFLEVAPFLDQPAQEGQNNFVVSNKIFKELNRLRQANTDKRTYGHCLVLAGSNQMPGASLMATMGALQSGAGLVTTFTPASVASHIAGSVPEAMWRPLPATPEGGLSVDAVRVVTRQASQGSAFLIGPGLVLDRSTSFTICRIVRETTLPLVLDASALTQDVMAAVLGRQREAGPVVLTPHMGEYARINPGAGSTVSKDELIEFSRKYNCITVLKGSPTRVSDGKRHFIVPAGGPILARGGAGDILSGMITTLLGQEPDDPLAATLRAVSWHGAAADALARDRGEVAVRTTEMLPYLSSSLRA